MSSIGDGITPVNAEKGQVRCAHLWQGRVEDERFAEKHKENFKRTGKKMFWNIFGGNE